MRYRIVITTYANGRRTYKAEKKVWLGWRSLTYDGSPMIGYDEEVRTREMALARIDMNFIGNTTVQKIEFEHITK